ncbi:hypothetical protein AAFC00_002730 [Neodothiora populina]|uniref:Maintenance of mitochondrial morphology protein 1 n=1 Tax=Neodothiora populina TaxID=2781224 RepID=A0ABR3P9D3_9PEZI
MSKAKQAAYAAAQQQSGSSASGAYGFASGFLVGQLTLAFILFLFIKFFIFGEPPSADVRAATRASHRRQRTLSHASSLNIRKRRHSMSSAFTLNRKTSLLGLNAPSTRIGGAVNNFLTTEQILAKTYYNVDGHQPESLDWFNVLIAQTIAQLRADALQDNAVLDSLTTALNAPGKPDFIDEIRITDISLGEEFPIFSNCRVIPVDENGAVLPTNQGRRRGGNSRADRGGIGESRLQARMDVDLSDVVTLGIETKLVLNYPKPFSAVLPVALTVSVVRFSGTLSLSFTPSQGPPSDHSTSGDDAGSATRSPTTLTFTFLDDYRLDLSVHSLIGSRSRLQDVPKVAQMVEQRIHDWFDERCVEPRFQQIVLPSLWPRKKNVRGGADEGIPPEDDAVPAVPGSLITPSPSPPPLEEPRATAQANHGKAAPPGVKEWAEQQRPLNGKASQARATSREPSRDDQGLRRRKSERKSNQGRGLNTDEDELERAGAEMRAAELRDKEKGKRGRDLVRSSHRGKQDQ